MAAERSVAARVVPDGLRSFLATETGSTLLLLGATLAGLVWANLPWHDTYDRFWETHFALVVGSHELGMGLKEWVNDGLMTLFFFVIGLEISREFKVGQLRNRRVVAVPAVAALGGMVVPAVLYYAVNAGGPGAGGWGIPMASDTAFVLGLLAVIGARCPQPLRIFLLTLAVVDDLGAISVVAIFYTEDLKLAPLVLAVVLFALIVAVRWLKVGRGPVYLLLGFLMWAAVLRSGVHPTIAGILLGVLVNVYAPPDTEKLRAGELVQRLQREPSPELAREARRSVASTVSVNDLLQHILHPWTSYVIVPLFALANAGVRLDPESLRRAATSPVTIGIVLGLVVGKFVGITLGTWIPLRLNWGELPGNLVWGQLLGGAAVAGIGFTVSLFITDLAFGDKPELESQAKIGILAGSVLAAALGWLIFRMAWNRGGVCAPPGTADEPDFEAEPLPPVTEHDHVLGPADAPVTLIEYGDYECPYCGAVQPVLDELRERYGDRLRLVFRHFPLQQIHPHAMPAALVAESAAAQGKFWEMHHVLFSHQLELNDRDLLGYSERMGFFPWENVKELERRVYKVKKAGWRAGVRGTPTFFLNGAEYQGPHELEPFVAAIDVMAEAARRSAAETAEGAAAADPTERPVDGDGDGDGGGDGQSRSS
ncbi:Na+/H+ antiporter NhaA [Actinomadura rupiterrae]|uniref:Na+/H+ antiporter NhaA n=1 Tax=Actinomadura rupiterrae TaxID=559627 RepID=UPI0020A58941|nr:Na+/H+ antiporter NhaA [Actinomadura rupiterrae]MCP2336835.1 Na+/H+ antiporter NhaA [Actinomadura rupiterrae]